MPLLVEDLPTIYRILDRLSDSDLTSLDDETFEEIVNFLDIKQVEHDFLTAIPVFYENVSELFTLKRIGNAQESSLVQQIESQRELINDLKSDIANADSEELQKVYKNDLIEAQQALGKLKKKLKDLTSNSLADSSLNEFAQIYGKNYSSVLLWVQSVSKFHKIPSQELWGYQYSEFLKLSNIQQLQQNLEYAQHQKMIAESQQKQGNNNKPNIPNF